MAGNIDPIFAALPKAAWAKLTTANTAKDGTGTVSTVCTAGVNGAYVQSVRAVPLGTNVASVLRVFLNNGGVNSNAANNSLLYEVQLPASTLTEVDAQVIPAIVLNREIPAGYTLLVTIGTALAAGVQVTATWGDF